MVVEAIGIGVGVVVALGGFAAFVLSQAKDQVSPVRALAETLNQAFLAHQEEDRGNYADLKADLKEIKELVRAKGPVSQERQS